MYTTTVRFSEELSEAVKLYCLRTGATVNGAVVVALERLVAKERIESVGPPGPLTTGTSGPALTPDDAQAETPSGVAWSHPSRGITGDLGGPLSESASVSPAVGASAVVPAAGRPGDVRPDFKPGTKL